MTLISSTRFFNGALLAGAMALISTEVAVAQPAPGTADSSGRLVQTWDKTFPRSEKVDHQKVTFKNRYGITLAADVYLPKDRGNKKLAALVISGPFGAVKEQASGLYAQTLAERGFVTLAFDPSYTGESSGEPRNIASPDINTEDFMAAVDFMGLQPYVDRERIGVIGICGMGGIALNAVAVDKRVKAVVASTMYDMSRVMSKGYNDSVTPEQREQALEKMSLQRWEDAANGKPAYQPAYNKLKGGEAQFLVDYADYYMTKRGYHPRAVNSGNSWSSSGAAKALGKVIPELDGRLTGYSLRVPVPVVSIVDLTVTLERDVTVEEVNNAFREAAAAGPLKGILGYSDEPLVSSDYQGDPRSSIIDGLSTLVIGGNMVKILAWYDNEWGFSNRLVDLALMMAKRES